MISREEIENLAELARLKLTETEATALQKDISNILEYVGQLSSSGAIPAQLQVSRERIAGIAPPPFLHNVMRDDALHPADSLLAGKQEALLKALPKREGDYAVVRKIIQKDE